VRWIAGLLACCACGRIGFDAGADASSPDAPAMPFGDDCVVGFEMNEGTWGQVIDSCGGDNPGTAGGVAMPVDDPVRGRVGQFGGPHDCITVANVPDLTMTLTASAWIYPTGLDMVTPRGVIARRLDDQTAVAYAMFVWTGDHVVVDIDSENDEMLSNAVIPNGQWRMITTVYDGTLPAAERVRIYIDGVLDRVVAETSVAMPSSPAPLVVGCLPIMPSTSDQQSFAGRLDDVGLWNRAFTEAEVKAWYEATR
jgi:hypothetical protein